MNKSKAQQWPRSFSSREERAREKKLRDRYGKIGIPAVAAAARAEEENAKERKRDARRMIRETD